MDTVGDDALDELARTSAAVVDLVDRVRADQWAAPSPCDGWTVARVVAHLVGMDRVFTALLAGQAPPPRETVGEDRLAAAFRESAADLRTAFSRPGVLAQRYPGPLGEATGEERLRIRLYDLLAHGWDVAQATGQPAALPEDAAAHALTFARGQLHDEDRPGRFAPPQEVSQDAPALDRLVAFLGRRVPTPGTPSTPGAATGKNGA